jgi:hypothetical protein
VNPRTVEYRPQNHPDVLTAVSGRDGPFAEVMRDCFTRVIQDATGRPVVGNPYFDS